MTNPKPNTDPFIDEVRELKRAASERSGHDLRRLAERFAELERRFPGKILPPPARQSRPPGRVA